MFQLPSCTLRVPAAAAEPSSLQALPMRAKGRKSLTEKTIFTGSVARMGVIQRGLLGSRGDVNLETEEPPTKMGRYSWRLTALSAGHGPTCLGPPCLE